jgi:hypothetical protein
MGEVTDMGRSKLLVERSEVLGGVWGKLSTEQQKPVVLLLAQTALKIFQSERTAESRGEQLSEDVQSTEGNSENVDISE